MKFSTCCKNSPSPSIGRISRPWSTLIQTTVEVVDTVPYRFDGKPLFAKFLNEAFEGIASTSFGFRQPSCRVYNDIVGIVNACDMFRGATRDGKPIAA